MPAFRFSKVPASICIHTTMSEFAGVVGNPGFRIHGVWGT
jgi:hypothetical protein